MKNTIITKSLLCLFALGMTCNAVYGKNNDALTGDGTLRFYRLAIPVSNSAYEEDLGGDYKNVVAFWEECEAFVNKMFVPLGLCFDVVVDERLVMHQVTPAFDKESYELPNIGYGTELINAAIGASAYDVGMWVTHRDPSAENSGLSALEGAYSSNVKGNGYAKTDKWVVAHELGHMFGATHTPMGEGSLMDADGEFFSYPSIHTIRNRIQNTSAYANVAVTNNVPQFDVEKMQRTYRIPQGACLSIPIHATDTDHHTLMFTAFGCHSANINQYMGDNGLLPDFPSFAPQGNNVINYTPQYTADVYYDDFFYSVEGTNIHEKAPGTYHLSILACDIPSTDYSFETLQASPFFSTYALWETTVDIVSGEPFKATLVPSKANYTAGEEVTLKWGVNPNYFTENSRLRISISNDYGKTFTHVLADNVRALDGACKLRLPNFNIGKVEVDFSTAQRSMNGGIIKIEEIGGVAFTLTSLDPMDNQAFTITGGTNNITMPSHQQSKDVDIYDLSGRRIRNAEKGISIINGKKVVGK